MLWPTLLSNLLCTVLGCLLSLGIGWRAAHRVDRRAERRSIMLETLLVSAEQQGTVELTRDIEGAITGGRAISAQMSHRVATVADINLRRLRH
jgi:hypothetical protein